MPPVSLPLNGGTHSARAGAPASIPHSATRPAAPIIRIADSIWLGATLGRIGRHEKNGRRSERGLIGRCCRAALDLARASRHRPRRWIIRRIAHARPLHLPENDPVSAPRSASCSGLLAFGQAAEAANPLELNFWLSGPRYDGRVKPLRSRARRPSPPSSGRRKAPSGIPRCRSPAMATSTKPRSGPGSPTTFRAAIAAPTSC